jgi:hypothetical protein
MYQPLGSGADGCCKIQGSSWQNVSAELKDTPAPTEHGKTHATSNYVHGQRFSEPQSKQKKPEQCQKHLPITERQTYNTLASGASSTDCWHHLNMPCVYSKHSQSEGAVKYTDFIAECQRLLAWNSPSALAVSRIQSKQKSPGQCRQACLT